MIDPSLGIHVDARPQNASLASPTAATTGAAGCRPASVSGGAARTGGGAGSVALPVTALVTGAGSATRSGAAIARSCSSTAPSVARYKLYDANVTIADAGSAAGSPATAFPSPRTQRRMAKR